MVGQKRRQIRGDRRVRCIGQAEFLEPGLITVWSGVSLDIRQESFEEEGFDLLSLDVRVQRTANQPRSSSWHTDRETVWWLGTEERFFDMTAHAYQRVPLTRR